MNNKEILEYALKKKSAYMDLPFGATPICIKVKGKLFVQLYPDADNHKLTLKCEAAAGEFYRMIYPDYVTYGYHCPDRMKPYFITVNLDIGITDEILCEMLDHSYKAAVSKLTKKQKFELENE